MTVRPYRISYPLLALVLTAGAGLCAPPAAAQAAHVPAQAAQAPAQARTAVPAQVAPAAAVAAAATTAAHPVTPDLPPSPKPFRIQSLSPHAAVLLPASVDLTARTPTPGNQGAVGSCTTWAVGYSLLGYYSATQPHLGAPFAPMYIYAQINGGTDAGASIYSALSLVVSQGVAERAVYTQGDYDWRTQPTAAERSNAAGHKVSSFSTLFSTWSYGPSTGPGDANVVAMKSALASGHPLVIAIPVYTSFEYPASGAVIHAPATGEHLYGYHAIAVFGYNATGMLIENSWGTGWGNRGYATLAWDFVNHDVLEASQITGFVTTNSGVQPVVTGLSTQLARVGGGGSLTITGTGLSGATSVQLTSAAQPSVSVSAPIRSATATTVVVTIPAVPAAGSYRVTVTTPLGRSAPSAPITFLANPSGLRTSGTLRASTGGVVTISGTGFGATSDQFAVLGLSVQVGVVGAPGSRRLVTITYLNDSSIQVSVPGLGAPGQQLELIVFAGDGSALLGDGSLRFRASIDTTASLAAGRGPVLLRVQGRGMRNSATWLVGSRRLPVLTSIAKLNTAGSGVYVQTDGLAQVKLPASVGASGTFLVSFVPNPAVYPDTSGTALSGLRVGYP